MCCYADMLGHVSGAFIRSSWAWGRLLSSLLSFMWVPRHIKALGDGGQQSSVPHPVTKRPPTQIYGLLK
jgi:hypothetical protein